MSEIFAIKECNYNLRKEDTLVSNKPGSTKNGINRISHLAPQIWEQIHKEIRTSKTLNIFKDKIKNGFLKIALVTSAKSTFMVLASFKYLFLFLI